MHYRVITTADDDVLIIYVSSIYNYHRLKNFSTLKKLHSSFRSEKHFHSSFQKIFIASTVNIH